MLLDGPPLQRAAASQETRLLARAVPSSRACQGQPDAANYHGLQLDASGICMDKDALQLFRNNPDRSHGKKCLLTCDLCSMNFMKLNALLQHHVKEHSFKEKVESVVFRTTMEFYTWKDNKERQTGSSFTVSTGKLQWMAVDVKPAFYCHHPRKLLRVLPWTNG
ncbi:hypothetical protein MRX96_038896 [Rhipicephalus microplus]